jgi:putative transposase
MPSLLTQRLLWNPLKQLKNTRSQEQNERLTALVGKVTVEKEWLAKKLKSLGSSELKQLVDLKPSPASISINHKCQLLGINRSGLYYQPRVNYAKQTIKNHITKVFTTPKPLTTF